MPHEGEPVAVTIDCLTIAVEVPATVKHTARAQCELAIFWAF